MEDNELLKIRKDKIAEMKRDGIDLYPNDACVTDTSASIVEEYGPLDASILEEMTKSVTLAGRVMAIRDFGKGAFILIQDRHGRLQAFVRKNQVGEEAFALFKKIDVGDIVFVSGKVIRTKTQELTVDAAVFRLLSKAVLPLPEKWHGLTDVETRYRQRHLDLITNPESKDVFRKRCRIIQTIRRFMDARDFLEVETPMMQPRPGGAAARPFKTHHNVLDMDLYLRIAPELYLKRLVTGGMDRVFEINRSFRNEGVSTFHNPEFTMMEFYQAYATYEDLMALTEELFCTIADEIVGCRTLTYQGQTIDLTPPWRRITVREAVMAHYGLAADILADGPRIAAYARERGYKATDTDPAGKTLLTLFEEEVEKTLIAPTFVTQYPVEVSPLARRNPTDPSFTDRFELIVCGRELANAFSELNDPADQRERFLQQLKDREAGDLEAHDMDEDYIRALESAMPPTAGEGIGIDRLVMLFTDSPSIRDVILFPHMRRREDAP